jgi:aminoglycoside phosphotransferase (APT) family kinase protein
MPEAGLFVGAALEISAVSMPRDLTTWAEHYREAGRLASWRDQDYAALLDLLDRAGDLTDAAQHDHPAADRTILVHSDLNTKNLLVDGETLQVTGVLDWEYAHAGSPYADLGNLTRFEREPAFVSGLVESVLSRAPALAANPLDLARASDLWALVELAGRVRVNTVAGLASELLLEQARTGDLHAWPWEGPRVDPKDAKRVP